MIKKLLFVFLLLSFTMSTAQLVEWVNTPSIDITTPVPTGYVTATDSFGNVYFAGYKDNPYSYTEVFGNLTYQKFASDGSVLFSKTITERGVVQQLQSDSQGNMLMAVEHLNTLTFDTFEIPNTTGLPQHVLLKISPSGTLLWHKVLTMPVVGVNTFKAIAFDASDNIYLGYDNYGTCHIEKLSPAGVSLQLITQQNVNRLTSLAVDAAGNMYATGSCANSNSTYAGVLQPTNFDYTVYLVKYNAAGVFQWIKYLEDITCTSPMVQVDGNGFIYWAADTFLPLQLGAITLEGPLTGGADFFLTKVSPDGTYLWAREVPGNGSLTLGSRNFLKVTSSGAIYLTGNLSGGITQWSDQVQTTTGTFSNQEILLLHYTTNGVVVFAFTAGGSQNDYGNSIAMHADEAVYLAGKMQGNATFGWYNHTNANSFGYSPFLAKISIFTFSVPDSETTTVRIYPNPVKDLLTIETTETITSVTVYGLNGQRIGLPFVNNQVDFSGVANGVYVVEVQFENGVKKVKVVR